MRSMVKVFKKIVNSLLIPILSFGIIFSLSSCAEEIEVDILDLAIDSVKYDLSEINEPLFLVKQTFIIYEESEYYFDVNWSYTNELKWKDLKEEDNYYILATKELYDEFDFELTATIEYDGRSKSKTFEGHYVNKEKQESIGLEILPTLENGAEITIEGKAINIYDKNFFIFHDGKQSIKVETDSSVDMSYGVKVELTLKVVKSKVKIGDSSIERITTKYLSHKTVNGMFAEYNSSLYDLNYLDDMLNNMNVVNFTKLDQNIIQVRGNVSLRNNEYYIDNNETYLKIDYKEDSMFSNSLIDFLDCNCIVNLFVDSIIEDEQVTGFTFSLISIFANE
ncbi:MAG: hypothetical protein J1F32_05460 [Erysipelotrichales bacterium]|nr:hypothetical protein [Erysipelotrichales bacterium]